MKYMQQSQITKQNRLGCTFQIKLFFYFEQYIITYKMNPRKRAKTYQNQILTKTEIALQAIKKYEARAFRLPQKNRHPLNLFRQIDDHYTRLNLHKQLKLDELTRLQIMPYNQQYFSISTDMLIFPVRIFIKNVKSQGILYVGYDKEFPGVERIKNQDKNSDQIDSQRKIYDYKFAFSKDIMCVLKNEKKKPIRKIFITIVAKKQLLMCSIKFDYIGYETMELQQQNNMKRALTEGSSSLTKSHLQLPSPVKKNFQTMYGSDFMYKEAKKLQRKLNPLKRSITKRSGSINQFELEQEQLEQQLQNKQAKNERKNFIQQNLQNMQVHRRQKSKQFQQQKKQKVMQSLQRIKANKQQLQEYKQKQRQIKEAASNLKKSIEHYQKIYKQEKVRNNKIINMLAPIFYLSIFMKKSNKIYNKQTQSITKTFSVRYIVKKFTKGLRKKYIESILQIGNFKVRNQMSCFHLFQLNAKMTLPVEQVKAAGLILMGLNSLEPALILNHSLVQSTRYRQSCRLIQKRWVIKYRARMLMLENFAARHVQSMLKEYPHLRLGFNLYKTSNIEHKICYEYMVDQSAKFRHIYDAYKKRVQEIDEFIQINYKIQQYNKGKPESKRKNYLDIPKKPTPPQHRIFRNLDILKSMLRGWFQLQYKKILKRSASGK